MTQFTGNSSDPMEFLRNLWGGNGFALPGMTVPTLDTNELEKQIKDLKTVEGWLRTNLSMLSMTIQNMEMQRTTLDAMRNMSQMVSEQTRQATGGEGGDDHSSAFAQAAMWPWNMMQQMQQTMHSAAADAGKAAADVTRQATTAAAEQAAAAAKPAASRRKKAE